MGRWGPICGVAILLCALVTVALAPAHALATGAGMSLSTDVNKSDDSVGVVVEAGAFPNEICHGTVSFNHLTEPLREVETGNVGGARWSWSIPGNLREGRWHVQVWCSGAHGKQTQKTKFLVDHGAGASASGLWIPGTYHHEPAPLRSTSAGNGGGGGPLYPVGQCTWWVARRRPDLPYFKGESGDALNWAQTAERAGFSVGTTPMPGAVAVFQPGQYGAGRYGHVAYVISVEGAQMTISEADFEDKLGHGRRKIGFKGLQFIYGKDEPPTVINPSPVQGVPTPGPVESESPPSPAKPAVELRGLIEDTPVTGEIPLSAISNAAGVRFSVVYFTDLASGESAQSVTIGEDRAPADGFTASWDTETVPNQGGPGGTTVIVTATALGPGGEEEGASSSVRVSVANSRTEGGVTYWRYYVVGLKENGEPELHLRSGPGYSEYSETGQRYDGDEVDVVCQKLGQRYVSPQGEETEIWDELIDGSWAIDYYVDTPNRGRFSKPLPRCA